MPRISIIVPVYKAEKYLNACIDSILKQTYEDFELILIDDGSPDRCPMVCDDYALKDKRVKVIHQKNSGVAVARNNGLEIATGEYITFVDSDDYIDPVMYERMLEVINEYGCEVVMCDCMKEFQNHTEIYTHHIRGGFYDKDQLIKEYYPHLLIMPNIEYPATISNWLCLFKSSIRNKVHLYYEPGIRFSEDWIFGAKLMMNVNSFYYMKGQVYYHYRMNEQSVTHSFVLDKWNDYCKLYECIKRDFSNISCYDFAEQIDKVLLFLVYNAVGDLIRTREIETLKKITKIKEILNDRAVREMFNNLNIWKLPISVKLKIQTLCYKYNCGIEMLVKYFERG